MLLYVLYGSKKLLRFADINIAVHVFHHHFAATTIDLALNPIVDAHFIHAVFGDFVGFWLAFVGVHVKIAVNLATVCLLYTSRCV